MAKSETPKRPTIRLTNEEHKAIKLFCVENDISLQEFSRHAVLYCMKKKILPEKK